MPASYSSPSASVLSNLFAKVLADELQPFAYHADCAELHYSLCAACAQR